MDSETKAELLTFLVVGQLLARALALPFPRDEAGLLKLFNLNAGWFLDYRSPVVQEIHGLCSAHLGLVDDQ
jgi:hypothetical protein